MFVITLHNQLKVSDKWQLHSSWRELLDTISSFFYKSDAVSEQAMLILST